MRIVLILAALALPALANAENKPAPPQALWQIPGTWVPQTFSKGSVNGPWTTASRPPSPALNQNGYNSTLGAYEFWNGATWIQLPALGAVNAYIAPNSFAASINTLSRLALAAASDNPQTNQPMTVPPWELSTNYATGERIAYTSGGNTIYFEQQVASTGPAAFCVSASTGSGPTSPGSLIPDGSGPTQCLWSSVAISPVGNAPTITPGLQWQSATAYVSGLTAVTYSGSGASAQGNFYTSGGGTTAAASASGTASFATNVMTVTGGVTGTFAVGQTITAAGIAGGTVITSLGSGTGGVGTYNLSTSPGTVSAEAAAATASGPIGTGTFADGTITWTYQQSVPTATFSAPAQHSYLWSGGAGNLLTNINTYGGVPANSIGTSYMQLVGLTVSGSPAISSQIRYEFVTTASKFVIRSFENSPAASVWRIIICDVDGSHCRYVSPNHYGSPVTGWMRTVVDFTNAGGRGPRDIIIETIGNGALGGIDVLTSDDVYKPAGLTILNMATMGDSYPAGGGVVGALWAYPLIVGDMLGIRNSANSGIGGCGYANICSSGTALSRIGDVTGATYGSAPPDVILMSNGTNDMNTQTPSQIAASQTAYVQAIRATPGLSRVPIFVLGIYAQTRGGASCASCVNTENAESAALVAMNDPFAFFCPWTTDPQGAWETGTGTILAQNQTGNTDWTFNSAANGHNNALGNRQFAGRVVKCIRNVLNAGHY